MSLDIWMFMGKITVFEEEDANAVFDRLEEVGIRNLVLGDLIFDKAPAYPSTPELYEGCKKTPPAMPAENGPRFETLRNAVERAKSRGFRIHLHDWGQGAPGCISDPEKLQYGPARTRDVVRALPGVDGFIMDGPEWGYEIAPGHRSDLFRCDCDCCRSRAGEWGYDFDALLAARDRLKASMQRVTDLPSGRRDRGLVDGLDLLVGDPDLYSWLRFKTDAIEHYARGMVEAARSLDPVRTMGCGPRLPAFAPLTGYNFRRLSRIVDFQCPKLYFWQHGIDGLKGTLYRYAETLCDWNPGLDEAEALERVRELFALWVPGVETLEALNDPLPAEFFQTVVLSEIAKMRERIDDVTQIRPWMGLHHGGVRLGSDELEQLLGVIQDGGLVTLIYWHYSDMTASDWDVVKAVCAAS